MTDTEKFQALKEKMISDNRQQYGSELEKTYDSATLEKSEEVLRQMNTPTFQRQETLDATLRQLLQEENPDPSTLAALHKEWLQIMWGDAVPYSKEAHLSLAQTYVADERFAAHYGGVAAAQRLLTALENHL